MQKIQYSFYGDDFTGSTDVMEALALNGVPTALFFSPPTREDISQFRLKVGIGDSSGSGLLRAFGVAGKSRSWNQSDMSTHLSKILQEIAQVPTDFFQYKVCSTFDSAPEMGSIGLATDIAHRFFSSRAIPLLVAAPSLNRFQVFGNLFARVDESTYRLDRHPTMSKHPVTPMHESDLRAHLSKQTQRRIRLVDLFRLRGDYGALSQYLEQAMTSEGEIILFDTLEEDHLLQIGRLLDQWQQNEGQTQLLIGSSGITYALMRAWLVKRRIAKPSKIRSPGVARHTVVVTGSASPRTTEQIAHMEKLGHCAIRMDSMRLLDPDTRQPEIDNARTRAEQALQDGRVPVLFTARGPEDPLLKQTQEVVSTRLSGKTSLAVQLGGAQGEVVRSLLTAWPGTRLLVAGGDTSGQLATSLGLQALETLYPMAPGAPLCLAHSDQVEFDGLEICLKGGQNGEVNFFESIQQGKLLN